MSPHQERIYFIGGTGGVGSKAVQDVLAQNIPVTIYTRQPEKSNFKDLPNVTLVKGIYDDLTPFENSITGHTRLFLLVANIGNMSRIKGSLSKIAYTAGVKQIVDISSLTIDAYPFTFVAQAHLRSEESIRAVQNDDSSYVSIRPWRFMSNHVWEQQSIKMQGGLVSATPLDTVQAWISPGDIGALAAIVLIEPIEKHGNAIYPMVGELLSNNDRAQILSKVFNCSIEYRQCSIQEQYDLMTKIFSGLHKMAYDFAQDFKPDHNYSPGLSLILGREPETLEQWLTNNKDLFPALTN
ncbi:hypothetical protein INT45_000967 [Circinella minor]|uniref:NmrA-like domain-containing protein n=1 Tax=Circinella minor TaxID=1195481 RepID=A0A8H7VF79_9FUNG|nr:hypothetical protein INT45_000967 [Circinella minor]